MERMFDMEIVKVEVRNDCLYHLDALAFNVVYGMTLITTKLFNKEEL